MLQFLALKSMAAYAAAPVYTILSTTVLMYTRLKARERSATRSRHVGQFS